MKPLMITKEDLFAVNRLNWIRNLRINKWKLLAFEIVGGILGLILIVGIFITPTIGLIVGGLVLILFIPFIIAGSWFFVSPFFVSQQFNKNKVFSIPYIIKWDETYFYISSDQTDTKLAWSALMDMAENNDYILLYSNNLVFHVIAKRYFDNIEEMESFLHTAKTGMNINHVNK